jgi:hypothetical protein
MPRSDLAPENMVGGGDDRFAALKLKVQEMARIWLPPEPGTQMHQPWHEWVHQIEAPIIEHGVAKMETKTRTNGETYPAYATTFIGNPICLGNEESLKARNLDADNCPGCESAQRLGKKDFRPRVRYASPCVRYTTKPGGIEVQTPFSAGLFVWSYPANRAKKLSEIQTGEGQNICMFDLSLGPCEPPETFQKYDIRALGSRVPAWKEHLEYIKELLTTEGNMPTDEQLQAACGRVTERKYMEEDLRRAEHIWALADGTTPAQATTGAEFQSSADMGAGLQDLLAAAGAPATPAAPAPPAAAAPAPTVPTPAAPDVAPSPGLDSLLPAAAPAPADVFPTTPEPAQSPGEAVSFEDLLGPAS